MNLANSSLNQSDSRNGQEYPKTRNRHRNSPPRDELASPVMTATAKDDTRRARAASSSNEVSVASFAPQQLSCSCEKTGRFHPARQINVLRLREVRSEVWPSPASSTAQCDRSAANEWLSRRRANRLAIATIGFNFHKQLLVLTTLFSASGS